MRFTAQEHLRAPRAKTGACTDTDKHANKTKKAYDRVIKEATSPRQVEAEEQLAQTEVL